MDPTGPVCATAPRAQRLIPRPVRFDSNMTAKLFGLLLLALVLASCNPSFDERYFGVQLGYSREQVKRLLGESTLKRDAAVPNLPYWGPQEGLLSAIGPNVPYEEWQYHVGDFEYYIWFSSTEGKPKEKWVVVDKAKIPKGAVFETTR